MWRSERVGIRSRAPREVRRSRWLSGRHAVTVEATSHDDAQAISGVREWLSSRRDVPPPAGEMSAFTHGAAAKSGPFAARGHQTSITSMKALTEKMARPAPGAP